MTDVEDIDLSDYLVARDHQEFDSISYNFATGDMLPEYGRGTSLNRYNDILPHPKTRVKLQIKRGNPATEYINANFVRSYNSETTGYIAAQGPTQRTLPHFIRMLWEQDVKVCVMLTRLKEGVGAKAKAKCEPYFPARLDSPMVFEDITVTLLASSKKDGHIKNSLQLKHSHSGETKDVAQFWYTNWPDHGVPEKDGEPFTREMILLVLTVRSFRRKVDKMMSPAVIHCSAGVGRTGAFIAIDQAIDAYKQKQKIDINAIVRRMREDRMALIQHTNQYKFAWAAAADYVVGKVQLNKKKKPRLSIKGKSPIRAAAVEFYRITKEFTNPDGNEGVLHTSAGDKLKLIDKSETWWWMAKADKSEGWVLASLLVPEVEYQKRKSSSGTANPFENGNGRASNPFQLSNTEDKPVPTKPRAQGNPFENIDGSDAAAPIASYNPNPFEATINEEVLADEAGGEVNTDLYDEVAPTATTNDEQNEESYISAENAQANPFMVNPEKEAANPFSTSPTKVKGSKSSSPIDEANPFLTGSRTSSGSTSPLSKEQKAENRKSNPFAPASPAKSSTAKRGLPNIADDETKSTQPKRGIPDMPDDMDDMMKSMMGGISDLDSRIAALKSTDDGEVIDQVPTEENVDDELPPDPEVEEANPTSTDTVLFRRNAEDAFFSDLQPWTYVEADGTIGTLFDNSSSDFMLPESVDISRIRAPDQIVGPAVVSHDHIWRCINDASNYAAERDTEI